MKASARRAIKRYQQRQRQAAIELLGGECKRCGFSDPRALQFDHIHGGGRQNDHKSNYYRKVQLSVLAGERKYQLLCANCNWIKRAERNENRGYLLDPQVDLFR